MSDAEHAALLRELSADARVLFVDPAINQETNRE